MQAYPNQIRFVYRDYPLISNHPEALPAAEAAGCANEQGKFWEYHEKLFAGDLSSDAYQKYAQELGLDMNQFSECVQSERYKDEIMADLEWASNFGVSSTPTFFLNGIALVGGYPLEQFTQIIDWELAGELPK
jgi:protein-disulfide isomerase